MLAFLFDRRSGLKTSVIVAVLALLLFAGGVLVGLNLRWSREEVASGVQDVLTSELDLSPAGKAVSAASAVNAPAGTKPAPGGEGASAAAPASSDPLPADWVPMTSGADSGATSDPTSDAGSGSATPPGEP